MWEDAHFAERSLGGDAYLVDHHDDDYEDGEERNDPADHICPHGIHVVAGRGRLVLDPVEHQDELGTENKLTVLHKKALRIKG